MFYTTGTEQPQGLWSLETYKARVYSHHMSDTYNTAYASLIDKETNEMCSNTSLIHILTLLFFVDSFAGLPSCSGYRVTTVTTVELTGCFKLFSGCKIFFGEN